MERETTIAVTGNNRASNIKSVAKHVDCIVESNVRSIYSVIFAATVPALLPVRSACGSFFFIASIHTTIHLSCLSMKHTGGVFSFK